MTELTLYSPFADTPAATASAPCAAQQSCEECIGTGGWYRYDPALDPGPGSLYLSCLQCRGSGWLASPKG